jgi:hypothetical protein
MKKSIFFFKRVLIETENKPESAEDEARIENLVRFLTLGERENVVTEDGFLLRMRREVGENDGVNGGASIVVVLLMMFSL